MLNSYPVSILVGTLLGFLSGLGIGGGSLLVLWLTVVLQMEPQTARLINLLFFIPSAVISCLIRIRNRELNWKAVVPAILAGCISAAAASMLSAEIDSEILKRLFGTLLIGTGIKELFTGM